MLYHPEHKNSVPYLDPRLSLSITAAECIGAWKHVIEIFILIYVHYRIQPHTRDTPFTPIKSLLSRRPALTAITMKRIRRLNPYDISA